ncbi:hypothetical protein [Paraburkholderia aspalathi]|uniref:hypothetical protein n=1 Tax=Paraburkholderia aspalathi TaxID=1324617 RepID=UPI0038BCD922
MNHHLLLGGTGRAGTTFLVQYLTACGLQTHLTKHPADRVDEHANAGLEDLPTEDADLPYVIKTPWLYEFVDRLLDRKDVAIDAVVLPMRDIVEAASSRVTLELRSRLGHPALDEEHTRWETWGTTPGGMVYALNPIDQARILAMGFHQVVHAFVKKQIPIVFLDFPRLVEDGEYLYEQLKPVFDNSVTREQAMEAHKRVARKDLVRVGAELEGQNRGANSSAVPIKFPSHSDIDRAALYRELKNAKRDADLRGARCQELEEALHTFELASTKTIAQLQDALREVQSANSDRIAASDRRNEDLELLLDAEQRRLAELKNSRLWKMAESLRRLGRIFE